MNHLHRRFCRSDVWRRTLEGRLMPWALGDLDLGDDVLEIGPGPGLGTDALKLRCERLSSIEVDQRLAEALAERMHGSNVTVLHADATDMPFEDTSFSGAVAFTMLHHVPSRELQDRLFSEAHRVLRPGAYFVGTDSVWSPAFALVHLFDTLVPVDPDTLEARLESAGFEGVSVRRGGGSFRFRARRGSDHPSGAVRDTATAKEEVWKS